MKKIILLAGGSGLIGTRLTTILQEQQYTVRLLTRTPRNTNEFKWNPINGEIDDSALQNVDYVVNLAGAGIADKRWTAARKRAIVESRVQAAQVLADAFVRTRGLPKAYVSASAIGFYGNSGEQLMTESDSPVENTFMVECCRQWEAAADIVALGGAHGKTAHWGGNGQGRRRVSRDCEALALGPGRLFRLWACLVVVDSH